jgi:hypothetical protein
LDSIAWLHRCCWFFFLGGGGVSHPLCLSSSLALHFFHLFFLGPPPC